MTFLHVSVIFLAFFFLEVVHADSGDQDDIFQRQKRFKRWQRWSDERDDSLTHPSTLLYSPPVMKFRGGDDGCNEMKAVCLQEVDVDGLLLKFGSEFKEALELNEKEHKEDCKKSCENFYCGDKNGVWTGTQNLSYTSYSMGSVPPEDFANEFKVCSSS
jgi:hypothetical protein